MQARRFLIAGGDRRQSWLARLLAEDGHSVFTVGLGEEETTERLPRADCLVLPIPPADGGGLLHAPLSQRRLSLKRLLEPLPVGQLVCSGGVTPLLQEQAERKGLLLVNYLAREELAQANAVPTAEGAVRIAMEELPCTLHRCPCLVLGAGRCGLALARRLRALGAEVWVSARRWEDFARLSGENLPAIPTARVEPLLPRLRLVVNTIPAPVLGEERLRLLREDALVLDLASRPGGVDWAAAARLGTKAVAALGLPGKESPQTAAENLRDCVYHIMEEWEQ